MHRVSQASFSGLLLAALTVSQIHADDPRLTVVTSGDSITRGVRSGVKPEETFAALLETRLRKGYEPKVVNAGTGGECTDQALQRLSKIIALKPQLVTIMYGTNDSYVDRGRTESRITVAEYEVNLKSIVTELRKAKITPILMTPPAWGKAAKNGVGDNPNMLLEKYVDACRKVARDTKTPLVDHFAVWSKKAATGFDIGKEWTTDQCHPNPRGHEIIAETMVPVILEALRKHP
jgi:lysophospholipase L1-like esterase